MHACIARCTHVAHPLLPDLSVVAVAMESNVVEYATHQSALLLNTQTANKADLLPVVWVVGNEVDLMLVSSWQVKWRWHKILL